MGDLVRTPLSEVTSTLEALELHGVSQEHLKRIRNDKAYAEQVASFIVRGGKGDVYPITVDYGLSLEQMIATGRYDWVNSDITSEHYPIVGTGTVALEGQLVHYGRNMSSEAVLADLDQKGLRPATMAELLAFGAKYPELQRQFPIVELGSVWPYPLGDRSVGYLARVGRGRRLRLVWFADDWGASYRFLAFRK